MNTDPNNKETMTTDQLDKKSPTRVSLLTILLVILAICIIGGGFFLWWQNRENNQIVTENTANTSSSPTSSLASSVSFVDPTAGWKTYTNTTYRLSFKYPSDWTLASGEGLPDAQSDQITINSSTGFGMRLGSVEGLGGTCGPDGCPNREILKSERFDVASSGAPLYIVNYDGDPSKVLTDNPSAYKYIYLSGTSDKLGISKMMYYPLFNSPSYNSGGLYFQGLYPSDSTQQLLSATDYFNLPDVKTGEQIFRTIIFR
ncbi:MAG: hypothetical protein WCG48_04005 [Candidatus Berkelbacteria bacterium]